MSIPGNLIATMLKPAVGDGVFSSEYLVVGGGGAGGLGGGGGAGGYLESLASFTANVPYAVTIGNGGISTWRAEVLYNEDGNGKNSSIVGDGRSIIALGGGSGATNYIGNGGGLVLLNGNSYKGATGGSGGGSGGNLTAAGQFVAGGLGTAGQGYQGGGGSGTGGSPSGGGGGAGGVGGNSTSVSSGAGGVGKRSSIITTAMATSLNVGQVSGQDVYFGGGGGGGGYYSYISSGGLGGGGGGNGNVGPGNPGVANTGGGGGGNCGAGGSSGNGGSGVVIIAYPTSFGKYISTSGSLVYTVDTTSRAGYMVYTFTAGTGTITFADKPANFGVEYLIVGGGGHTFTAGGGAGGMIENTIDVAADQVFQVRVGLKGQFPNNFGSSSMDWSESQGKDTYFSPKSSNHEVPFEVLGGGRGAYQGTPSTRGGSGGGGARYAGSSYNWASTGTSSGGYIQGYSGGDAASYSGWTGGGGGGAGGNANGLVGGPPRASSITGSTLYYAAGARAADLMGSVYGNGGGDRDGVFILAYPDYRPLISISGTLAYTVSTTSRPGYRVYTFTAGTGTVTFTA